MNSATIVQKLWNYCNVLRDDGLSYQDYIEQLTFLLFLKMADEQTRPPFNRPPPLSPHERSFAFTRKGQCHETSPQCRADTVHAGWQRRHRRAHE